MTTESQMTDAELAELEGLAEGATEGPWEGIGDGYASADFVPFDEGRCIPILVAPDGDVVYFTHFRTLEETDRDRAFIGASRTAIPRLIATIKALKGEISYLETELATRSQYLCEVIAGTVEPKLELRRLQDECDALKAGRRGVT